VSDSINGGLFTDDPNMEPDLDVTVEVHFSQKDHPEGKMVPIQVEDKEEYILIPLNIKNGATIKVSGRGKYNPRSGKTGDLYVVIKIKEQRDPPYKMIILSAAIIAIAAVFFLLGKYIPANKANKPEESACAHVWVAANCVTPKTCSICGEISGSPIGHEWTAATCTSPKTCIVCGEVSGTVLEHKWLDATYSSPKTCSICQVTDGDPLRNPLTEMIRAKLPIVTFATNDESKIYGYEDAELTQKCADYYFKPATDELVITDISDDGKALEIRYPSSLTTSGYRTLWFPFDSIISLSEIEADTKVADKKTETFRYSPQSGTMVHYGTMDAKNKYIGLGKNNLGYEAIVYSIYKQTLYDTDISNKLAFIK